MSDEHSGRIPYPVQSSAPPLSGLKLFKWIAFIAVVYFGIARLSLLLAFQHTAVSPLWPPAGIGLAAVLLLGYRVSAGIFIGAFATNIIALSTGSLTAGPVVLAACSMAVGNTLESLIGAYLVRRFTGVQDVFRDVKSAFLFVIFGALIGAAVAAFVGVTAVSSVTGTWAEYRHAWFTWLLGDATGIILVSPLFLSWHSRGIPGWGSAKISEAILALFLLCTVSALVYVYGFPIKFLTIPVLLFIILRFGLFETALSLAIFTGFAVFGTVRGFGQPLGAGPESLLLVQSYIGVIAITALFLSVVVGERQRSVEAFRSEKAFSDTVINSVPGAFYVLNHEGQLVRWNRFLEQLNDVPSKERAGMDSLLNIHENDRERVLKKIREAFQNGESETEARINTRGRTRDFIFTGRRVDIAGTAYVVGTGIDITERKLAEHELDQHRKTLEAKVADRTRELTELNTILASEIDERRSVEKILSESEANYRNLVEGANSVILRWAGDGTIIFLNRFGKE
ncbi:MAG TPA: MASE1 domain-containing protein, partial [Syntrophorhabdaceae bacterium]|nr:MASE1 domain-containing protein [Syntrophorhabdaceae bacterium]